jgi:acyl carrier protein
MTEPILAELQEVMRATFGNPLLQIAMDTDAEDVDGWDSLAHARLIVAVEERFGISLPAERLFELTSVGELVELIAIRQGAQRQ